MAYVNGIVVLAGLTAGGPEAERVDGIYMMAGVDSNNVTRLLQLNSDGTIGGSSLPTGGTTGQFLRGDSGWSNTLEGPLKIEDNLTVYGTDVASANYERLFVGWDAAGPYYKVSTQKAGSGTQWSLLLEGLGLSFATNGAIRWNMETDGHLVPQADNVVNLGDSGGARLKDITLAGVLRSGSAILTSTLTAGGQILGSLGTAGAPGISFTSAPDAGMYFASSALRFAVAGTGVLNLTAGGVTVVPDLLGIGNGNVFLRADAANTLALRNSTAAQAFHIYNTWTDINNYERLFVGYLSNSAYLVAQKLGSGSDRNLIVGSNTANLIFRSDIGGSPVNSWQVSQGNLVAIDNYNIWNGISALATTATAGFLGMNSCAGTPTGVPASVPTGQVPLVFDTTGSKLWAYFGGSWKAVALA